MGIHDRDYYREDGSSFLGSLARRGQVCKWLVAINVVVFVLQVLTIRRDPFGVPLDGLVTDLFQLDTARVLKGEVWRLLTYAFLHSPDNLLHIVFNMLFLWWFGSDMEDLYGAREFLTFYLLAALLGGLFFQAQAMVTGHAMRCLGASGAVTAVMVLFACHYPHRLIYIFFVLPVPIWLFVVFQVVQDSFGLLGGNRGDNVAVSVHLGGAAFGYLYYKGQWRLSPLWTNLFARRRERSRPRLRVYRGEDEPVTPAHVAAAAPASTVDEQLEAKLDAVLEKVARSGQASLTESEREILFRASEIYKRRRT